MHGIRGAVAFAAVALAAAASWAQSGGVYLDVKRLMTSKDSTERAGMSHYSDKDTSRTMSLSISVRSMGQQKNWVALQWFFVAKTLNGNLRWIYDQGAEEVEMGKASMTNFVVTSKDLQMSKYESSYYRTVSGSKPEGYIVRAKMADKVVAVAASSRQFEQAARDEKQIAAMLEAAEKGRKDQPQPPAGAPGAIGPAAGAAPGAAAPQADVPAHPSSPTPRL